MFRLQEVQTVDDAPQSFIGDDVCVCEFVAIDVRHESPWKIISLPPHIDLAPFVEDTKLYSGGAAVVCRRRMGVSQNSVHQKWAERYRPRPSILVVFHTLFECNANDTYLLRMTRML